MKTAIAYEVFYFLKVFIFEDLLILNGLYFVLHFGFTILLKNGQKKKGDDTFLSKKTGGKT